MGLPSTVRNCLSSKNLHFQENFQQLQLATIKMSMSKVKQNFHSDSEALINKQINMELYASYVYLSMSAYFARDDVALHGFSKRFRAASHEEREHAETMIDYQTMRGGRVVFREVAKPTSDEWGTALEAIEASLELEKTVNESLLNLHKMADTHHDAQLTDFIEGTFLKEQVEAIKEIGDLGDKITDLFDSFNLFLQKSSFDEVSQLGIVVGVSHLAQVQEGLIHSLLQLKTGLDGLQSGAPLVAGWLCDLTEHHPSSSHSLVVNHGLSMLPFFMACSTESLGEAMKSNIITCKVS